MTRADPHREPSQSGRPASPSAPPAQHDAHIRARWHLLWIRAELRAYCARLDPATLLHSQAPELDAIDALDQLEAELPADAQPPATYDPVKRAA